VLTGVGGKLVPDMFDAAFINARRIFGARRFDILLCIDV